MLAETQKENTHRERQTQTNIQINKQDNKERKDQAKQITTKYKTNTERKENKQNK